MRISDIKGEKALDVLADLIDPFSEIVIDNEFTRTYDSGNRIGAVKIALKNHKKSVIRILAILNDENPETYEPNLVALPKLVFDLLDDPELAFLFTSQRQTVNASSGVVTENTEAKKK